MRPGRRARSAHCSDGRGCTRRTWRRQREEGILNALTPRRRGRPSSSPEQRELARLRQENERLSQRLVAAEAVIEVQKKVALLLGLVEPSRPSEERS
jgi:transposase